MPDDILEAKAKGFAEELAQTVSGFTGQDCEFVAQITASHVSVTHADPKGIPLTVGAVPHVTLIIEYQCDWDSSGQYLAIASSWVQVFPGTKVNKEPLFRYEYLRKPNGNIPCAHLQVHAHRDAFTHALSAAGRNSTRGKRLGTRDPGEPPALSAYHFPLGGTRFRPCLEDVLQSLQDEFGLDAAPGWEDALCQGRERWRKRQIGASVRDSPEQAARVLRELGYRVEGTPLGDRLAHLRQI